MITFTVILGTFAVNSVPQEESPTSLKFLDVSEQTQTDLESRTQCQRLLECTWCYWAILFASPPRRPPIVCKMGTRSSDEHTSARALCLEPTRIRWMSGRVCAQTCEKDHRH